MMLSIKGKEAKLPAVMDQKSLFFLMVPDKPETRVHPSRCKLSSLFSPIFLFLCKNTAQRLRLYLSPVFSTTKNLLQGDKLCLHNISTILLSFLSEAGFITYYLDKSSFLRCQGNNESFPLKQHYSFTFFSGLCLEVIR